MINLDISRRALLGGLASASVPTFADAGETRIITEGGEHPSTRLRRLADDLSEALNAYEDGRWMAKVYPSNVYDYPVMISRMEKFTDPSWRLSVAIAQAKKALFDLTGEWPVDASKLDERHNVVALGVLPEDANRLRWFFDDSQGCFPAVAKRRGQS